MGKHLERMHVTGRDQFEHSQFRRAQPGCAPGKLFEHFQNASPKLRQDAQIPAQQIEPRVWRRRPVGLPRKACDLEMMIVDRNARELQFGKTRRFRFAERGIHVPQNDAQAFSPAGRDNPSSQINTSWAFGSVSIQSSTVSQRSQASINPRSFMPNFCRRRRRHRIEPVGVRPLARPRRQKCCQLRIGTRRPPNHPKFDGDSQIGKTGRYNAARTRRICRQDQTRHGTPRPDCLREGLISIGFQRHRLSLVRCVPPHQRSIGLCRLKSSLWARTALPNSVIDSRLRR